MSSKTYGLTIIYTGDGKGKTTAALGLALRAFGSGLKILILQFIKNNQIIGELKALQILREFNPAIELKQCGSGFVEKGSWEEHKKIAQQALNLAREEIVSGKWNMIILDEINYSIKFGLLRLEEVLDLVKIRPSELHLVFTGRDAVPELIEVADLVTEMKLIKHPFQKGIFAQKGIEF